MHGKSRAHNTRITYLERGEVLGTFLHIHPPQANTNGTGRDNNDLVAILPELDCSRNDHGEDRQQRLMGLFVHNGTRP